MTVAYSIALSGEESHFMKQARNTIQLNHLHYVLLLAQPLKRNLKLEIPEGPISYPSHSITARLKTAATRGNNPKDQL